MAGQEQVRPQRRDDAVPTTPPSPPARRGRAGAVDARSTTSSTRSTACSSPTPRSSCAGSSRRVASDPRSRQRAAARAPSSCPGRRRSPSSSRPTPRRCCPRAARCRRAPRIEAPHGTTIVTLTFDGGVVMAGDRRATMGNLIANRDMEKVFAADEYQPGRHRRHGRPRDRAGPAVPGRARALREDRGHPDVARGQGQPARLDDPGQPRAWRCRGWRSCRCSPGSTSSTGIGRIFSYDVTGGCYEEHDHHSVGSGSLFARGLAEEALAAGPAPWTTPCASPSRRSTTPPTTTRPRAAPTSAAGSGRPSASSTTTGRGSCPTTRSRRWSTPSSPRASTTREVPDDAMPFYVSPEQLMKDRADFARKGIARGRSVVVLAYDNGIAFVAENPSRGRCTRSPRSTTGSPSPRSASTTSSRTCAWPGCATPTCAATPTTAPTSPPAAWPTPTPRPSAPCSPRSPSPTRSRSSSPRSARPRTTDQIYRLTYDGSVADEHGFVAMGGASGADRERPEGAVARRA